MSRLHAHEWGEPGGTTVICLHGVTGHGARWRRLAEGWLADRRLLAFDLRGHGRSPAEPPWDVAAHVRDLIGTADALGIERADWIGHSFSGKLVAALANGAPERVRRACLLDPALALPPEVCLERAELERAESSYGSAEEAIAERLDSGLLFHTPRELLEEEMAEHLVRRPDGRLVYRYCPSAVITAWGEMADAAPPVADVPTLMIRGAESWIPLDEHEERYRSALGERFELVRVPGGHTVMFDALEETGEALAAFLG